MQRAIGNLQDLNNIIATLEALINHTNESII